MTGSIEDGEIIDDKYNNFESCSASHPVFGCKTCNRQFSSFQALGGHRSTHTRPPKLLLLTEDEESSLKKSSNNVVSCSTGHRFFKCTTCDRQFSSFQALGGHRASHRRLSVLSDDEESLKKSTATMKGKVHKCSICGEEFAIGQALGGHMKKHRVAGTTPIFKKSNINQRIVSFDLNLMPWENNL